MKKIISLFLGIATLLLAIPTSLIIASWNALPGDRMYPVKIQLERIAVRLMGETALARQLEVKYTERRFSEADKLLAQEHSTIGFALATAQAKTAKEKVIEAQDTKTKETLVTNLIVFNQELEKKKEEIKTQASASPSTETSTGPLHPPTPVPTATAVPKISPAQPGFPTPTPKKATLTPTPTPLPPPTPQEPEEIIEDIEETQGEIEEIIEELEEQVSSQGAPPEGQRQNFLEEIEKIKKRREEEIKEKHHLQFH